MATTTTEWSTKYPSQVDTATEQPDLTNNVSITRVSQIHAVRDAVQTIQGEIGKRVYTLDHGNDISRSVQALSGASGMVMIVSGSTVSVTGSYIIPSNVHLVIENGGALSSSATIGVSGTIEVSPYAIFDGDGTFQFGMQTYSEANKPSAAVYSPGFMIVNSEDGGINIASGSTWISASAVNGDGEAYKNVYPATHNTYELGANAKRWKWVYGYNGAFSADITARSAVNFGLTTSPGAGGNASTYGIEGTGGTIRMSVVSFFSGAAGSQAIILDAQPGTAILDDEYEIASMGWTDNSNVWTPVFKVKPMAVSLPSFTVATAPSASEGDFAWCTDGDAGAKCLTVHDGTDWKVVSTGSAIASS